MMDLGTGDDGNGTILQMSCSNENVQMHARKCPTLGGSGREAPR